MNAQRKFFFYKFVRGSGQGVGPKASLAPKFQFGGGGCLIMPSLDPPLLTNQKLPSSYVTPSGPLRVSY